MQAFRDPLLEEALVRFSRLVKATSYYPDAHPSVNLAVNACAEAFKTCLAAKQHSQEGYISIEIRRQGFMRNDEWLDPENKILPQLAQRFFIHKIKALAVFTNLREQHLLTLAHCLVQEPHQLASKGGAVSVIEQAQASSILLNEINLAAIGRYKHKTEAAPHAPAQNLAIRDGNATHRTSPDTTHQGEQSNAHSVPAPPEYQPILPVLRKAQHLIDTGARENLGQFQACLEKIRRNLDKSLTSTRNHDAMQAMVHFDNWIHTPANTTEYVECCRQCLHSLDQTRTALFLLDAAGHDARHQGMATRLIKLLAADSSTLVWRQLISEPDPRMRRFLAATMEELGSTADTIILEYMDSPHWYIIRNAVKILGTRRNPDYIQKFSAQLMHSDHRVVKEALSALAAIRHDNAVDALLNYLDSPGCALPELAILALGVQKNPRAIPILSKIAMQRDRMLKLKKIRIKAIEALGEMRDPAANKALISIAKRGKILKHGEYQELRLAAITALGKTATSAEYKILHRLCSSGNPAIAQCARKALQNRQKDAPA